MSRQATGQAGHSDRRFSEIAAMRQMATGRPARCRERGQADADFREEDEYDVQIDEWAARVPTHRILTGVSVTLKLDVFSDGQGLLSCPDAPQVNLPVANKREMQVAIRELWDRAVKDGIARSPFSG